jgi:hypothetical protein
MRRTCKDGAIGSTKDGAIGSTMAIRIPAGWFASLRKKDELFIGEIAIPFLGQKPAIEVWFECPGRKKPSKVQRDTFEGYASETTRIHRDTLRRIFQRYQMVVKQYRTTFSEWGEDPDENAPLISKPSELSGLLVYQVLFIPDKRSTGTFGMGFWSKWEREHGVGVRYVNWSLDEVGNNEVHFSF